MKIDEYLKDFAYIKAMVKGPAGSGKTYLAASASKLWKTMYIDAEGGLLSASQVIDPNMDIRLVRDPIAVEFFNKLKEAVSDALSGDYECVIIDSLGEIAGRMEDDYATKSEGTVSIKDWFALTERIKRLSRLLRDGSFHTIVTCLTKPTKQEEGQSIYEPILPGQTAAIVPSFFDVLGLMRKVKESKTSGANTYVFTTEGPSIFQVRDRTHTLQADEVITADKPEDFWRKLAAGIESLSK